MQTISFSSIIRQFPLHPPFRPSTLLHLRSPPPLSCSVASPKRSSPLLSAIDRAIEEDEYRKARSQVNRKGVDVEGYMVEGISVGGHETSVIVPSLNAVFDIGRCPSAAVSQDHLFITHAHLDHIVSLVVDSWFYLLIVKPLVWNFDWCCFWNAYIWIWGCIFVLILVMKKCDLFVELMAFFPL